MEPQHEVTLLEVPTTLGGDKATADSELTEKDEETCNWAAALPTDARNLIGAFVGAVDEVVDMTYVSKLTFPHSDAVYAHLMMRLASKGFLAISTGLAPKKGDNRSWHDIAKNRKRVRTNGFYSLKEMITRAPSNDDFWTERKVKAIETIHYRYLRFLDDGVCLYTLQTQSPWENPLGLEPKRLGMDEKEELELRLSWYTSKKPTKLRENVYFGLWYWGDEKGIVCTRIRMPYCELEFQFNVLNGRASYGNYHGNNSVLQCIRHAQVCEGGDDNSFLLPINHDWVFHRRDYFRSDDNLSSYK